MHADSDFLQVKTEAAPPGERFALLPGKRAIETTVRRSQGQRSLRRKPSTIHPSTTLRR